LHTLDVTVEGLSAWLLARGTDGTQQQQPRAVGQAVVGLGCEVRYTLPGVSLDVGASSSPSAGPSPGGAGTYTLWWDAERACLNDRKRHVVARAPRDAEDRGVWTAGAS